MEVKDILKTIKKIEIKSRRLSNNILSGKYHTAFKGNGMEFSEIREYQYGDDVKNIDWNISAKTGDTYVKLYKEERELTIMLLIDVSQSTVFGSNNQTKKDLIAEISALLAFSAISNNDKVGALLFSGKTEKYIKPQKSRKQIFNILREIIKNENFENNNTDLNNALKHYVNIMKKNTICFIISDFFTNNFESQLKMARNKHQIFAIKITDPIEEEIPKIGICQFVDLENNIKIAVNTNSKTFRTSYQENILQRNLYLENFFKKMQVDYVKIVIGDNYVEKIQRIFNKK